MVAVATSVSSGGWLAAIEHSIQDWAEQVGVAELSVTQGSPVIDRRHVPMRPGMADMVAAVPGVKRVERFRTIERQVRGEALSINGSDLDVFLEEAARRGRGWQVMDGSLPGKGELAAAPRMLLAENAANRFKVRAGDKLVLPTREGDVPFEIRAVIVDYTAQNGAAFIDRAQLLRYFGDEYVDGMFVFLDDGARASSVASALRVALGRSAGGSSIFVTETSAVEEHILDSLRQTFSYSRSVEVMMLLIALMGVIGTMTAAVIDRRREIAIQRAIGATTLQVAVAIVVEAGFLGVCAAVAGIAVGVVECMIVLDTLLVMETGWHLQFAFPWAATGRTLVWVIGTSALAGAVPAIRAARGSPIPAAQE
jgi:putative ABC transport system permease protein